MTLSSPRLHQSYERITGRRVEGEGWDDPDFKAFKRRTGNRAEYISLTPMDSAELVSIFDNEQQWERLNRIVQVNNVIQGGVKVQIKARWHNFITSVQDCPGGRSEIRWCVEWADEERQKQFEQGRGGCRENNLPTWSDRPGLKTVGSN